ncbi:MAG: hypothetical protein K6G34_06195 [Lachnospiraceae bacterium]|nr:hypothetical protein [Lachnospiraceae bacterium]
MNKTISVDDFKTIMRGLIAAYPRDNFIPNEYTFNLWYSALHDFDYVTLNKAAQAYMMLNKYPPTIADIRRIACDMVLPADEIAAEEWNRLMKALGQAGSPDAVERWQKLPEVTREIVGGFSEFREWSMLPITDLMTVHRPMFIKRFEERMKQKRLAAPLPVQLRKPERMLEEHLPPLIEDRQDQEAGRGTAAPADLIAKLRERLAVE